MAASYYRVNIDTVCAQIIPFIGAVALGSFMTHTKLTTSASWDTLPMCYVF